MAHTILIAEDDKPLCWLLEKLLSKDFHVIIKNDGLAAMNWLAKGNVPDLLLCDYGLPHLNGLELIENLRSSSLYSSIPTIICSSRNDRIFIEQCNRLGVQVIIEKPFDPNTLIRAIYKNISAVKMSEKHESSHLSSKGS